MQQTLAAKLSAQGVAAGGATTSSIDAVARAVTSERPAVGVPSAPDGTVTVMFSDIEQSTEVALRLGDERWLEVLRAHNGALREQIGAHGGTEVKSAGDGFMVVFSDPVRAVACAVGIQRSLRDRPPIEPVRVRIGLHAGPAIEEEGDFFGRTVTLAARIADAARGGEILISSALAERAGPSIPLGDARTFEPKGFGEQVSVRSVGWAT
jgi:class 3 adenylate cyclase